MCAFSENLLSKRSSCRTTELCTKPTASHCQGGSLGRSKSIAKAGSRRRQLDALPGLPNVYGPSSGSTVLSTQRRARRLALGICQRAQQVVQPAGARFNDVAARRAGLATCCGDGWVERQGALVAPHRLLRLVLHLLEVPTLGVGRGGVRLGKMEGFLQGMCDCSQGNRCEAKRPRCRSAVGQTAARAPIQHRSCLWAGSVPCEERGRQEF